MKRSALAAGVIALTATAMSACTSASDTDRAATNPKKTAVTSTAPTAATTPPIKITPSPRSSPNPPGIGDTITLTGIGLGEKVAITLVRVVDNASPADPAVDEAPPGKHWVAVQVKFTNVGKSVFYGDATFTGTDASGNQCTGHYVNTTAGASLDSSFGIDPGRSQSGWITLEVADGSAIASVQKKIDIGSGPVASWTIRY